jgi:hypothetical protein
MSSPVDPARRFQVALDRSRASWALADPERAAHLAGCVTAPGGVVVPFFGRPHLVTHPDGVATVEATGQAAHVSITIMLIHHLLAADGSPSTGQWIAFRDLPDGLFYARAFAGRAENYLAARLGTGIAAFREASLRLGGQPLSLADASYVFQALPRVPVSALLWAGDDEFPVRARILFDASAGHYLPTEDLSGLGDWLAHHLAR